MRQGFFPGIQLLRGAAALLVVLQHSIFYAAQAANAPFEPYLKVAYGQWGVMLFFCISGFVIGLNRHTSPATFFLKRALRIYPAFLVACALSIALLSWYGLVASLDFSTAVLLPVTTFNDSLHIPYWTLIFEVAFYALATVVFALRLTDRALSIAAICWIVIVEFFGAYFPNEFSAQAPGLPILVSPYTQLFAFGLLACLHHEQLARFDTRWLLGIAAIALALLSTLRMTPAGYTLVYGAICFVAVTIAARADTTPGGATVLGDASYGLYLLHLPILVVLAIQLSGSWLAMYPIGLWATMAMAAIASGVLFGLIEHGSYRRIVRLLRLSRLRAPVS